MRFEALEAARERLQLHDRIGLQELKDQYRNLMKKWHPDTCKEDPDICAEEARQITEAYQLILDYIHNYKYSLTEEEAAMQLSGAEWWMHRFGPK